MVKGERLKARAVASSVKSEKLEVGAVGACNVKGEKSKADRGSVKGGTPAPPKPPCFPRRLYTFLLRLPKPPCFSRRLYTFRRRLHHNPLHVLS